jgi:ABC-2 type transport system ATP-binding protein
VPSKPAVPTALTVANLSHRYGERVALKQVNFSVPTGSIFALLGPNGGGKTTLFRIISTLLPTQPGGVEVFGHDVEAAASAVRRLIGVMFQSPALDRRLTVHENLRCHGHLYGIRGRVLDERITEALALVTLDDRADDLVQTLSGGLQRRVELAKALLPDPRLLVLDEPSTGLDPGARREIWDHLVRLRQERGTTVVLTTHLMDEAARADRVAVLHEGVLVALGAPEELVAAIGGNVILITSPDLETLARGIRERFDETVEVLNGHLRIERSRGHAFIADLVEAFPGQIDAVTYGKPTLEDVFLHHTGQRWN